MKGLEGGCDPQPLLHDLEEPGLAEHDRSRLLDQFVEHLLGDVWLDRVSTARAPPLPPTGVWGLPQASDVP